MALAWLGVRVRARGRVRVRVRVRLRLRAKSKGELTGMSCDTAKEKMLPSRRKKTLLMTPPESNHAWVEYVGEWVGR